MGKGDPKTKAKRNRAKFTAALPALAPTPRREIDGKSTRAKREPKGETGADIVALDARARQIGRTIKREKTRDGKPHRDNIAANKATRAEMRKQSYGEAAGRAITLARWGGQAERLLSAYRGLTAAEERYHRVVLGQSIHAKTAKLEMMPDRLETSADDAPPDLRSEEDRHRAAVNEWMRWKGYTQTLCAAHRSAIWNASRGLVELHRGDALTPHGRAFIQAIEALADVVDGNNP